MPTVRDRNVRKLRRMKKRVKSQLKASKRSRSEEEPCGADPSTGKRRKLTSSGCEGERVEEEDDSLGGGGLATESEGLVAAEDVSGDDATTESKASML